MDDVDRIVAGLSQSQRVIMSSLSEKPTKLADIATRKLSAMKLRTPAGRLRDQGLVFDEHPRNASCLRWGLTTLGTAVRARLAEVQSHE